MGTILQKRIRNAAIKHLEKTQGKEFNSVSEEQCLRVYAFEDGANWALQNQWIPVEEAPQADIPNCFVAYRAIDMVLYSTGSYDKDSDEWYVDGVGFNTEVTHYMPIPSLEGGEK